jgi:hypothetical protein
VLKLDIEGHELAALNGARDALDDGRIRAVTLEATHGAGPAMRLLEEHGFRPTEMPDTRAPWIARRRRYAQRENVAYTRP